ncbi:MAG: outer membrane protein assembly factor BamD [Phycisphaerae bacterium]
MSRTFAELAGFVNRAVIFCVPVMVASNGAWADDTPSRTHQLRFDAKKNTWIEVVPPPPGTPAGDLHVAKKLNSEGEHRQALRATDVFIAEYGENDLMYPDALLIRAQAQVGLERFDEAHETLSAFLTEFGGMGSTNEALRLEFLIAETYLSGVKRKFLGARILPSEDEAFRILDDISIDYPESPMAEAAIKTKGDYMFREGDHALAEFEYERMLNEYPNSRYYQYALVRSAEAALASHGGIDYDEAALIEAEERYLEYQRQYPGSAQRDDVQLILTGIREQRAEKEFQTGDYYERTDHLRSAVFYYQLVVQDWPGTLAASKAARKLELIGPGAEMPENP